MIVRPWVKGDNERIELQEQQRYLTIVSSPSDVDLTTLSEEGLAWTGEVDGQIMAMAGLIPQWENRALAWALLSEHSGPYFVQIHKAVKSGMIRSGFVRIEAQVDVGFPEANRWMNMLGFELEGYMRAFRPDGADMLLYARVRR